MSPQAGDDASSPDSLRPGALANVFRGLTGSKTSRSPPPLSSSSSAAASTRIEFVNAITSTSHVLSTGHTSALELLKNGTPNERIEAANALKYAIAEYPLTPVLEIWDAAKELIDPAKTATARAAGWELLTECAKHDSSTDLERREYFQTLSAPAHSEDFHLQLAALVDLTSRGRVVTGFDYELLPLLTRWLQDAYDATRAARKSGSQPSRSKTSGRGRAALSGEEKNFSQLFSFLTDVIKFSFNSADEASVVGLIDALLCICMSTSVEDDLRSCISVVDAIVTFGSIPNDKLKDCVQVLSSIFCLVPGLYKDSWHTVANLCRSHNGQATVRILLDILRNLSTDKTKDKDPIREVRGALAVLQKLMSKRAEKGYPTVPYALLVDGLSTTIKATTSSKVHTAILQLINSLFDDGEGHMQRLVVDENWSAALDVAVECSKRVTARPEKARNYQEYQDKDDFSEDTVVRELLSLVTRLDTISGDKSGDFIPRQTVIKFFTEVHHLLPDHAARTVLDYFQEFRCCSPSDLQWEENLALVLRAFFGNRSRSSDTRLRALKTTMDAYEIVDLVGDGAEQNFIPRLAKSILQDVAEETDVVVLDAVMSLMATVVVSCDMELFDYVVDTLRVIVVNDRLKSPINAPSASSPLLAATPTPETPDPPAEESPSNVVIRGYVKMFVQVMNFHGDKSVKLYNVLVSIAKAGHCEIDARLTAMKLLFRLRADWANRIFVTSVLETSSLATAICRTDASLAKKQAEEAALSLRHSRSDHGTASRSSRGMSIGQGQMQERGIPGRPTSHAKSSAAKYHQKWKLPDPAALPDPVPTSISPVLLSHAAQREERADDGSSEKTELNVRAINISWWLEAVLSILRGCDWEVYSFVLVHLPSQLSNHAIFHDAISQIQDLRKLICEQIRTNGFQEPPNASGLRRADVAICLFHSLTMILSYHEHFQKSEEDEIVRTFVFGIAQWERSAKYCIHALSICCHELPLSTSKSLIQMLNQMAAIITQPQVSVHILEFLACLSRLHHIYVNFREDEYRIVFAICFRYLEYAREKNQSNRSSHASEPSTPATPSSGTAEPAQTTPSDELPQYVHALAYHVILFWFLALKLPDRATHVGWIIRKLFADADGSGQTADEQTVTSIDFLQRVTYADVEESAEDPRFTEERFGEIVKKRWLIGNSIVTVKQAKLSGWAHIVKRQPSGTSAYTIRETYGPPPPHQVENHVDVSREGQQTTNAILPSHLLVQLMSPIPQTFDSARPIPLPEDEATERTIRIFDRNSTVDGHKVGVIYIGEGQTGEAEILSNVSGSSDYVEFLNSLGTLTRLKGANFNTQGLDREYDIDGQYTFCWRDRVTEIIFHVTTQMPTRPEDPSCSQKKRHIGNDFVNIIFNDSGLPFNFDTFPSQFNFVNIVITPASRASFIATRQAQLEEGPGQQPFYRVQVMSKPGFPEVSPASETKMVSLRALPGFIRLLALNASMFSLVWYNREGGEHISSWTGRLREIKRLRERHGPRTAPSPIPPREAGAAPGPQQQQQAAADASRPNSTVRDSFSSLRRASMATFFTNTSEQPSHRSSTLSGSTTTNDTEVGMANAVGALMDSVDFSKWA